MKPNESENTNVLPLVDLGITDASLAILKDTYKNIPDPNTPEGYDALKVGLSVLVPLRTGVEKKRKLLKADSLEYGRKIDTEAGRVTAELLSIEQPMRDAKSVIDDAEKLREQEEADKEAQRIADIEAKVEEIKGLTDGLLGADVHVLQARADVADNIVIDESYGEFEEAAKAMWTSARQAISKAIGDRQKYDLEQAELEKLREEKEKRDQEDHDKRVASEAAGMAKKEAEEKARKENERIEAEKQQAIKDKEIAIQAIKDAKARAEQEKKDAVKAEQDRVAREKKEAEEAAKKREANNAHRKKINNAAASKLKDAGLSIDQAKEVVTLIAQGKIPRITIAY